MVNGPYCHRLDIRRNLNSTKPVTHLGYWDLYKLDGQTVYVTNKPIDNFYADNGKNYKDQLISEINLPHRVHVVKSLDIIQLIDKENFHYSIYNEAQLKQMNKNGFGVFVFE